MKLDHCGGRADRGIDLRGTWTIPSLTNEPSDKPRVFPVVVSCKATKGKSSPQYIRELEGAIGHASSNTIGIMATISHCTPGAKQQMLLSQRALAYCYTTPYANGGYISQFVWNKAAGVLLQGLSASIRHTPGKEETGGRVVLTVNGQVLCKLGQKEN